MSGEIVIPFASSVRYRKNESGAWWCKSHQREATHVHTKADGEERHCCDPKLGGILLPCDCEELPGAAPAEPEIGAVENILKALEGMQTQVQALTDLVIEQDARLKKLEGSGKSKIIQVRN